MKINKLQINSYGKIKNKEINFNERINIIHGKNESGKSTILKFITNSLYGISKNKNGREYSDFEKYKPWQTEEFSGKIEYELDNNERYEVFRDFRKKNPQIFNKNKEDISKQFNIDKNKGNEFFYEQTKIDEKLFLSTIVVNQGEVKLEKNEQNILIQKIANLVGTGEDNVSYKKAIDRINKRQLDEIGTERSREKPLNILLRENDNLLEEKRELEKYKNSINIMEENKNNLINKKINLEIIIEYLNKIKIIFENNNIENEKIKIKENIEKENIKKINNNNEEILKIKNENEKILEKNKNKIKKIKQNKNKIKKILLIIFLLLLIINIAQFIFIENNIIKYIFLLTVPIDIIFSLIKIKNKNKLIKNMENEYNNEKENIEKEKNNYLNENKIIEKNNLELKEEINNIKNNLNININLKKEKIKNEYLNKIKNNEIIEINNLEKINMQINIMQKQLNEIKINLRTLEFEKEGINTKLDNLVKIEEKIENNNNKILELKKLEKSMIIAKEFLTKAYNKMKNTVTPKFTQNLSQNIASITDGKYTNVSLQDDNGIIVELKNGNYVEANRLSTGTIEQLYLSLRLSMTEELSKEKLPMILDESFAYYDTTRLENILKYLINKYKDRQIIIFSCTEREINLLNQLNIKYNKIDL
mgnify:CR=1 FL=1